VVPAFHDVFSPVGIVEDREQSTVDQAVENFGEVVERLGIHDQECSRQPRSAALCFAELIGSAKKLIGVTLISIPLG